MKDFYKALNDSILKPVVKPAIAAASIGFGIDRLIKSDYVGAAIGFAISGVSIESFSKDYGYSICGTFKNYVSEKLSI
ncbi:MAG: hypothetical protein WA139_06245 [Candidatus Aenigmatarchaeota archaeon]